MIKSADSGSDFSVPATSSSSLVSPRPLCNVRASSKPVLSDILRLVGATGAIEQFCHQGAAAGKPQVSSAALLFYQYQENP